MNVRPVPFALLLGALAACGGSPSSTGSGDGRFRIVPTDATHQDRPDLVFAHRDAAAATAAAAYRKNGRTGIRFVGIGGGADGSKLVADGLLDATVERPTGAVAAIDMALLACHGLTPPRRLAVGTRVLTKATLAAGGRQIVSPADFVLENLRRQHADVLTTQPKTDNILQIAAVVADPALRDALIAAAKRYPQVALEMRATVQESLAKDYPAVVFALADAAATADACKAAKAKNARVVIVGAEPADAEFLCSVGADEQQLGEAAGALAKELLGEAGGAIVELPDAADAAATRARHEGFVKALGLAQKP